MSERWKIVDGYENYAVSTLGRVRNLKTGRLLKHQHSRRGGDYAFINLFSGGERKNKNVHKLVAEHFMGPTPDGKIIHHKDNDRMNPALDNLEFLTRSENNLKKNRATSPALTS